MIMTITTSEVISAIKRHLSIIGKRLYTKDGKNLFSNITLSSVEDKPILKQYIYSSAQDIEAVLKQFVTASSYVEGGGTALNPVNPHIEMTISNTRGDSDFDTRVKDLSVSYITLNSVGEYLSMVHPEIAQKYQRDARQKIEALVSYVFYKNPPTATADPLAATSSVTT